MIEKQAKNAKKPLPEWLVKKRASKPKLAFGLDFYYNAFWTLCTERVFSEVVLHLAWSKIQMYADYWEMDFDDAEQFHYLMKKMDDAYVENMRVKDGKTKQDQPIDTRKPTNERVKPNPRKK
jgi:hypothetical protein